MNKLNAALDARWSNLQANMQFVTPDKSLGSPFSITSISNNSVEIKTDGGTIIWIGRQAFVAALDYLAQNLHTAQNPCEIASDKDIKQAGPLCVATRNANGKNVMIGEF